MYKSYFLEQKCPDQIFLVVGILPREVKYVSVWMALC